jgi:hypothetical protein
MKKRSQAHLEARSIPQFEDELDGGTVLAPTTPENI